MISGLNSKKNKNEICKNIEKYINIYNIQYINILKIQTNINIFYLHNYKIYKYITII